MKEIIASFKQQLEKLRAYEHAMGVVNYDMETVMPRGAAEVVGQTLGALSEEAYKLSTSDALQACIEAILAAPDGTVDEITRREAQLLAEDRARIACIPMDEYVAYQVEVTRANNIWHEAKLQNDFASFLPSLKKVVEMTARFARYYKPDAPVYDTLLDQFEKGLTMATLDVFFADVRKKLVPLIEAIHTQPDCSFLRQPYPIDVQKQFSDYLMDVLGLDRRYTIIGETEHPFTTNFTKYDVRITTHYHADDMVSSMYSVIHEGGHATYERNIADELALSPLGEGVSMGVHESQSRFFENIIGRSEPFIEAIFPKMQALFPTQLAGVTPHAFYLAVNKAEPSLIRTEADELTYPLHVLVRYELEKRLFDGTLAVEDLPDAWNKLYKSVLGVDVPSDREGVLQDSHWASGLFGYFPSYAIGSAYGAQLLAVLEREMDVWSTVRQGDLKPIVAWLTDRIYRFGRSKDPADVIADACGAPFDPNCYTDYLRNKFTALYNL